MRNVDSKLFTTSSDDINRSADGITSKKNRTRSFDDLQLTDGEEVHGVPILIGSITKHRVVESNSINQKQSSKPGESAQEGRALTMSRLLDDHAWDFPI